jgi:hypothetical protein
VNRRSGASEIENPIHLDIKGKRYVMTHHFEQRTRKQMRYVSLSSCIKIVDTQNVVTLI